MNQEEIKDKILRHWNDDKVESMYDKHLISLEIGMIAKLIRQDSLILDAGCGEGEGTIEYSQVPGVKIIAADYSETRLAKAKDKLRGKTNVEFRKTDFLAEINYPEKFDTIVSQRFLINLMSFDNQQATLKKLTAMLKKGGSLVMLEGSTEGVDELNQIRTSFGLEPINIPWHNAFFDDKKLEEFAKTNGLQLVDKSGLGTFFVLTRAIRPYFDKELNWDSEFNRISASIAGSEKIHLGAAASRIRLWHFRKA